MRLKNKSGCFAVIYIRTLTYCLLLFCILCHDSQNMSSLWINIYIAPLFINFTVYSLLQPSNISMQREMRSKNNEKHNAYFRQRGECDGNARWWWFMHIMDRASQMNDSVAQQFKVMLSFSIKLSPMAFNFFFNLPRAVAGDVLHPTHLKIWQKINKKNKETYELAFFILLLFCYNTWKRWVKSYLYWAEGFVQVLHKWPRRGICK